MIQGTGNSEPRVVAAINEAVHFERNEANRVGCATLEYSR